MSPNHTQTASSQPVGAIVRPDEPRHFMVIEHAKGTAVARIGERVIAASGHALLVKEVGRGAYPPVVYFPPGDVHGELLVPVEGTTFCPLKGTASYYDIAGAPPIARAAWSYQQPLTFDPRLSRLECCVAFDPQHVVVEVSDNA